MKPNFAIISERVVGKFTELYIDPHKATLKGRKLMDLGVRGKRKFENLLIITRPRERLKVIYQI